MSIGTYQQAVDQEKFGQHFDETFKKNGYRPGKTIYVVRDGEIVKREGQEPISFISSIDPQQSRAQTAGSS